MHCIQVDNWRFDRNSVCGLCVDSHLLRRLDASLDRNQDSLLICTRWRSPSLVLLEPPSPTTKDPSACVLVSHHRLHVLYFSFFLGELGRLSVDLESWLHHRQHQF